VKGYHDIAGDGGSRVLEQVVEQRARITDGLAGVRHARPSKDVPECSGALGESGTVAREIEEELIARVWALGRTGPAARSAALADPAEIDRLLMASVG